ncbi:hypothetical protein [Coleofasciculus sp.]
MLPQLFPADVAAMVKLETLTFVAVISREQVTAASSDNFSVAVPGAAPV